METGKGNRRWTGRVEIEVEGRGLRRGRRGLRRESLETADPRRREAQRETETAKEGQWTVLYGM